MHGVVEFIGLAADDYSVFASVKGYSLAKTPVTKKEADGSIQTITLSNDIKGYVIKLDPEE